MKVSKKGIESIIKRLYSIEEAGEMVINPKRIDELLGVISARYDDVGYNIITGVGVEILEVYKTSKTGVKTIYRGKIGKDSPVSQMDDNPFVKSIFKIHTNEIVNLFQKTIEKYGFDAFKDRKKASAFCNDLLLDYPEEKRIFSMLFKEGVSDLLMDVPIEDEIQRKRLMTQVVKFAEHMGMKKDIQEAIGEIISRSMMIERKSVSDTTSSGTVIFISKSNSPDKHPALFEVKASIKDGDGKYSCKDYKNFSSGMNNLIDVVRGFFDQYSALDPKRYDYSISITCLSEKTEPRQLKTAVELCLYSAIVNKKFHSNTTIVVNDVAGEKILPGTADLKEVLLLCNNYNVKNVLLPMETISELACVPKEVLLETNISFYGSTSDLFEKSLG